MRAMISTRPRAIALALAVFLVVAIARATTGGSGHPATHTYYPPAAWSDQSQGTTSRDGSWVYHGIGGNAGGNGGCAYYNDPDSGSSVMTGNC